MPYQVNEDLCIACGACECDCPAGAIELGEKAKIDPGKCAECGTCAATCPAGAISAQ